MKSRGFTIVEIMIVLAIAGLILLLIFKAIPTLQRNSNNNQRRQDIQSILEAVSHSQLNNSGNIPSTSSLQASNPRLSYYDISKVSVGGGHSGWSPSPNSDTDLDRVYIYNYQKCSTVTDGSSTSTAAGYSDIVALFAIETGGGPTPQCQQL